MVKESAKTQFNFFHLSLIFTLMLVAAAITGVAQAAELHVPSAEYPTIPSAINAAGTGDTVIVASGTYPGDIFIDNKQITLRSETENPDDCIIDGANQTRGFIILNSVVTIKGFQVKDCVTPNTPGGGPAGASQTDQDISTQGDRGGGMLSLSSNVTLLRMLFLGCLAQSVLGQGGGIFSSEGELTMQDSLFDGCMATEGSALYCHLMLACLIDLCMFARCESESGTAMFDSGVEAFKILRCFFAGNVGDGIVNIVSCLVFNEIIASVFACNRGYSYGAILCLSAYLRVLNCTFVGNTTDEECDNIVEGAVVDQYAICGGSGVSAGQAPSSNDVPVVEIQNGLFDKNNDIPTIYGNSGEIHVGNTGAPDYPFDPSVNGPAFYLDYGGNVGVDTEQFPSPCPAEGDWDGDGFDDLALFRPSTGSQFCDGGSQDPDLVDKDALGIDFDPVSPPMGAFACPPLQPDLKVEKSAIPDNPKVGEIVEYTIIVQNLGNSPATGVVMEDILPEGVKYESHEASVGTTYNDGVWTIGEIANYDPFAQTNFVATLTIRVTVLDGTAGKTIENTAEVTEMDQEDRNEDDNKDEAAITIPGANLQVTKTVDKSNPNEGDLVTYIIRVGNWGPDDATGVEIKDILPDDVQHISDDSNGSYKDGIWTVSIIPNQAAVTLTIIGKVKAGTAGKTIENIAEVKKIDQDDPDKENDIGAATLTVSDVDLKVIKTVDKPNPEEGGVVTYTIRVENWGTTDATGVEIEDILPKDYVDHISNDSGGNYDPDTGIWTVGTIPAQGFATLKIKVKVKEGTAGKEFTNLAELENMDQVDMSPGDEEDEAVIVVQRNNLKVTKIVDKAEPKEGEVVTYTITVENTGTGDVTGVEIEDILPDDVEHVSDDSGGSYAGGVWTIGTISKGGSATLEVKVKGKAGTAGRTIFNSAIVKKMDQKDTNPDDDESEVAFTVAGGADLKVIKTVDKSNPKVGEVVTYTIRVENWGPEDATGVEVEDILPEGVELLDGAEPIPDDSGGSYDPGTGIWTVGTIPNDGVATLTIKIKVKAGTAGETIENIAEEKKMDQGDPDDTDNKDEAVFTVQQGANLQVVKTANKSRVKVGEEVEFTVELRNLGLGSVTGVKIKESHSPEVEMVPGSHNASEGTTYDPDTKTWDVGTIHKDEKATLRFRMKAVSDPPDGKIYNTAEVTEMDQVDTDPDDNKDTAFVEVEQSADLQVSKQYSPAYLHGSETINGVWYQVSVLNKGPGTATGVEVEDKVPYGTKFVLKERCTHGTYSSVTGKWNIGTLAPGEEAKLAFYVELSEGHRDSIANIAKVTKSDQADPDKENNKAEVVARFADPYVEKIANKSSAKVGDIVEYTITVGNNGPAHAFGVKVDEPTPQGMEYDSHEFVGTVKGRYSDNTWDVGRVLVGNTHKLIVRYRILPGNEGKRLPNNVKVGQEQTEEESVDRDDNNNESSVDVTVWGEANLDVEKTVPEDEKNPNLGDTVTFTVTVTNKGPHDATNVEVTDLLEEEGLIYGDIVASDGTNYDKRTGVWSVGDLRVGANATLTITATVKENKKYAGHSFINSATVTSMDQEDPDKKPAFDSVSVRVQSADVQVKSSAEVGKKRGGNSASGVDIQEVYNAETLIVKVGDTVIYTIEVINHGPSTATGIEINDQLFPGVTYVSSSPAGVYNAADRTVKWNIDQLAKGDSATFTVTVTVDSGSVGTAIDNVASVTAVDQVDPNDANSAASKLIEPIGLTLKSASYQVLKTLLTLTFNYPVDPALTCFDWIGMEYGNSGQWNSQLANDFGLTAVPGTPYEDPETGETLYPVNIDILCAYPATMSLAIAAFVTCRADDVDVLLQRGAFNSIAGGNVKADMPLNITVNGLQLRMKGDVSGNGEVTAYDAALILKSTVHGRSVFPIYLEASEMSAQLEAWGQESDIIGYLADTDNSGGISSFDAARVLQFSAGMIDDFSCESCAPVGMKGRRNASLKVNNYGAQSLEVSVELDDVRDVYSAGVTMTYDPQTMTVADVSGTPAISDWLSKHGMIRPGELRVSLAGASAPVESGALITISFDVVSGDAISKLSITELELNGGRLKAKVHNLPKTFALLQNYPNPFNPETWVPYRLAEPADVTIIVYNVTGQMVRRLELGNMMPGHYVDRARAAYWDGRNEWGEEVSSGIYFYQLQAGRDASVKKMIVVE